MEQTPCIVVSNITLPPVTVNIDSTSMLIAAEYNYETYPETPAVAATVEKSEIYVLFFIE